MTTDSLLQRRFRVLGQHSPLFYDKPLHLVRGDGVWVYDADGKRYLDAYNNVPHVGHCHPQVVEALCKQARTLNSHTRYLDETVVNVIRMRNMSDTKKLLSEKWRRTVSTVEWIAAQLPAEGVFVREHSAAERSGGDLVAQDVGEVAGALGAWPLVVPAGGLLVRVSSAVARVHPKPLPSLFGVCQMSTVATSLFRWRYAGIRHTADTAELPRCPSSGWVPPCRRTFVQFSR